VRAPLRAGRGPHRRPGERSFRSSASSSPARCATRTCSSDAGGRVSARTRRGRSPGSSGSGHAPGRDHGRGVDRLSPRQQLVFKDRERPRAPASRSRAPGGALRSITTGCTWRMTCASSRSSISWRWRRVSASPAITSSTRSRGGRRLRAPDRSRSGGSSTRRIRRLVRADARRRLGRPRSHTRPRRSTRERPEPRLLASAIGRARTRRRAVLPASYANREAVRFMEDALRLAPRAPEAVGRRARWKRQLGEAYFRLGRPGQAQEHLQNALTLLAQPVPSLRRRAPDPLWPARLGRQVLTAAPRSVSRAQPKAEAALLEGGRAYDCSGSCVPHDGTEAGARREPSRAQPDRDVGPPSPELAESCAVRRDVRGSPPRAPRRGPVLPAGRRDGPPCARSDTRPAACGRWRAST